MQMEVCIRFRHIGKRMRIGSASLCIGELKRCSLQNLLDRGLRCERHAQNRSEGPVLAEERLKLGEKIRPHERGGLDGCFAESSERSAKLMTANKLDWLAKFASSPTYSISIFKMWYLQKILDPANVILQTSQRSGPAKREEIE